VYIFLIENLTLIVILKISQQFVCESWKTKQTMKTVKNVIETALFLGKSNIVSKPYFERNYTELKNKQCNW